jgi:hypothetical protein
MPEWLIVPLIVYIAGLILVPIVVLAVSILAFVIGICVCLFGDPNFGAIIIGVGVGSIFVATCVANVFH